MSVLKAPTTVVDAAFQPQPAGLGKWLADRRDHSRADTVVPAMAPGERILLRNADDSGHPVVATLHGLYRAVEAEPVHDWTRWGWEAVDRVDWVAAQRALTVRTLATPAPGRTVLRMRDGARLAAFAAERVAAARLLDTHVVLGDGRVAHIVARCRPGVAEPVWIVELPAPPNGNRAGAPTDQLVTAAIARLRRSHGL